MAQATVAPQQLDAAERRRTIAFLNWAHAIDHFVMLIYPTVVIGLEIVYQRPYSELIALSSLTFVAFGLFSLPAGWLADRWSRRNMMAAFYFGCGLSLVATAFAPNLLVLGAAMFVLGVFTAIYHPVGMAMLIAASNARGRSLAFNGVCGNLGVSLAAGISAILASWLGWRAAFLAPAALCLLTGAIYLWVTPNDLHEVKTRKSTATVPLTPRVATMLFGLFIVIALTAGVTFNLLTIALPKIVDEGLAGNLPLWIIGSVATAVLVCGALAQLTVGRLSERIPLHFLFAAVTGLGFLSNVWAAYASGFALMLALAAAVASIYGQITVNDMVMARYTADAWRGRVYSVRYFLLFIGAGVAIGMISLLHNSGGFGLVLAVNAAIALCLFITTIFLVLLISGLESQHKAAQPAE